MLILTQRLPANAQAADIQAAASKAELTLSLTAEDRCRSRHRWLTQEAVDVQLQLPRGTVLLAGDLLGTDAAHPAVTWVRVMAKPEPVLTTYPHQPQDLARAAYHLGNRHVPLEIGQDYLRLSPDPVLAELLVHLGFQVTSEVTAFFPEAGAYHSITQGHTHSHPHEQPHAHPHAH
jgi:urease accessory protein